MGTHPLAAASGSRRLLPLSSASLRPQPRHQSLLRSQQSRLKTIPEEQHVRATCASSFPSEALLGTHMRYYMLQESGPRPEKDGLHRNCLPLMKAFKTCPACLFPYPGTGYGAHIKKCNGKPPPNYKVRQWRQQLITKGTAAEERQGSPPRSSSEQRGANREAASAGLVQDEGPGNVEDAGARTT